MSAAAQGAGEGSGTSQDAPQQGEGEGSESEAGLDVEAVLRALGGVGEGEETPELDGLADHLKEALGDGADRKDLEAKGGRALSDAAKQAMNGALEAHRAAAALERVVPGIGWGTAPGALHRTLGERLDRFVTLLERLESLKALADALGRVEEEDRRQDQQHGGHEEVVGVRLGGDVSAALPSELALLGSPETEDLFYARWLERRLVSLELQGAGMDGVAGGKERGPAVLCVDTSASMSGAPEVMAKALVLAVCRRLLPAGRTVHLLLFGGPNERTELVLRRGRGGLEGLLDFLALSFDSGTDFDTPLLRAMELLDQEELHKADVLVVTDGRCRASQEVIDAVKKGRAERGARVWSVVLASTDLDGVLPFSDQVWKIGADRSATSVALIRALSQRPSAAR